MDRIPLNNRQTLELFNDNRIRLAYNFLGPFIPDGQTSRAICEFKLD